MNGQILILGASGRLGHAAADAFRRAGWSVTGLIRPGTSFRAPKGITVIEGDALNTTTVTEAAHDMDVVLHALNPISYSEWRKFALPLAYNAIAAAEAAGATLMFPGNVYNYGAGMPDALDELTPMRPTTRKGQLRVEIEERMREATERGVRTIIVRAGDFFGAGHGSWFDLVIVKELAANRITYPGPLNVIHEWAYVPDLAATMVKVAAIRERLEPFETFGFPGHAVTGQELMDAIAAATGRQLTVKPIWWPMMRAVGLVMPLARELAEISYLWQRPHRIAGNKLRAAISDVPHTPFPKAIRNALADLESAA